MTETSANWVIDDIIPGEKLVRRALAPIARLAGKLSMLPSESDLSLSEHVRRPGEIGSVVAEPTLF